MCETVQNFFIFTKTGNGTAVDLLIQEKAGFLAIFYIYIILNTIFFNDNLGIKRLSDKTFVAAHAFLFADFGIAALIYAADHNTIFSQDFFQKINNFQL